MVIHRFPPVESADDYGILAVGGDLDFSTLHLAYRNGIFPWPISPDIPLAWFAPPRRGVLFLEKFHCSRRLERTVRRRPFEVRVDSNFSQVIRGCAGVRKGRTWITSEMIGAYERLHREGYAHSIEAYRDGALVGGLYGVSIGGMFAGESMFYREADASKVAFVHLVHFLVEQGLSWVDCQILTPFLATMGAEEISRAEFMGLLQEAVGQGEIAWGAWKGSLV